MKPQYLPSVCQTHAAHYEGKIKIDKSKLLLKKNEVVSLRKLCELLSADMPAPFRILDGYYVGFSIPQIANEFDLLPRSSGYLTSGNSSLLVDFAVKQTEKHSIGRNRGIHSICTKS